MFRNIFSKYFSVIALIITTSYMALCGMQLLFSLRYWQGEKERALTQSAQTVAGLASGYLRRTVGGYTMATEFNNNLVMIFSAEESENLVLIAQLDGTVIRCSDGEPGCRHVGEVVGERTRERIPLEEGGALFETSTLDGVFSARQFVAAAPIIKDGMPVGYVFVASPVGTMGMYVKTNLQVFFIAALMALSLTFVVLYVLTYRMVRPLRAMSAAARRFGEGDFSTRLAVRGQDEVAQLAAALDNMAVSLASLEDMRRSFVANISHELKTPMTTIAGFIDGILDGTIPAEKHAHYLKIVSDEVKRLSRLVKSMLDLSRIDSGQLRIAPVRFDLTEVVCTALLSFEQRIEAKDITVSGMEDCGRVEVTGDFDLLGQVVYNLLDNAVKFTGEGGELRIRLERREHPGRGGASGGRVYCTVYNTGVGVAAQEMVHIFDRFYKSDRSRGLDKNGVGLGLYIVKSVIGLHGGEIVVRSETGRYCEFEFWLPDEEEE